MTASPRTLDDVGRLLRARQLTGLIVYSDGTTNILRPSYLRYFAGFAPLGPNAAAIVTADGTAALIVEPRQDARRAARHTWIDDVAGTDSFADAVRDASARLGVTGRVGLAGGREMPYPVYQALTRTLAFEPADDVIETMAREKTAPEIERVKRAAAAADAGFEAFRRSATVGVREYEIVAEVEYAMRLAGADDNFILLSTGAHNRAMRAPTDRRVEAGDIVIGEISPVVDGQFVQLCRTVSVGPPNPALVSAYELLLRAYRSSVARLHAGVPASLVAITIDDALTAAGYGEYCRPPYMRTRGHGFGVGSVAPGALIDADTSAAVIANQVIVVHPNQYLPETGYLACGETHLVTPDGCERLARTETKLWINEA
jgi:Xaa-Pro aminopeptidase